MATYQVVTDCAYVRIVDAQGVSWRLLPQNALFYDETPNLEHLLRNGYVVKVGAESVSEPAPVVTEKQVESNTPPAPVVEADPDAEAAREAARVKLAEMGGTPDGRSSDAVMVEYLVANGYDRAEAEKADRSTLKQLVASVNT